ncbi:MAG TPA: endonuclease V, partial [Acidimicrobiia bacterium]
AGATGAVGDRGWAAAVVMAWRRLVGQAEIAGEARAPYVAGLLAAREGALLEEVVHALLRLPDVLLVNATGTDHPRRAGLALHLGWVLDLPTVGVTHRPLVASGDQPGPKAGDRSALWIEGTQVGWWLRTRTRARPVAVSPGWQTGLDTALEAVKAAVIRVRTPEPIRQARRLARSARSADQGKAESINLSGP